MHRVELEIRKRVWNFLAFENAQAIAGENLPGWRGRPYWPGIGVFLNDSDPPQRNGFQRRNAEKRENQRPEHEVRGNVMSLDYSTAAVH